MLPKQQCYFTFQFTVSRLVLISWNVPESIKEKESIIIGFTQRNQALYPKIPSVHLFTQPSTQRIGSILQLQLVNELLENIMIYFDSPKAICLIRVALERFPFAIKCMNGHGYWTLTAQNNFVNWFCSQIRWLISVCESFVCSIVLYHKFNCSDTFSLDVGIKL